MMWSSKRLKCIAKWKSSLVQWAVEDNLLSQLFLNMRRSALKSFRKNKKFSILLSRERILKMQSLKRSLIMSWKKIKNRNRRKPRNGLWSHWNLDKCWGRQEEHLPPKTQKNNRKCCNNTKMTPWLSVLFAQEHSMIKRVQST